MPNFSYKRQVSRYLTWFFKKRLKEYRYKIFLIILSGVVLLTLNAFTKEKPSLKKRDQPQLSPGSYRCTPIKLDDGDSLMARCQIPSKRYVDIRTRIWGIDAPEMGQKPWGKQAKLALNRMISKETITIDIIEKDRYQRYVSKIYKDKVDVGLEMVKQGYAVVYYRYNQDPIYKKYENNAKIAKRGIWSKKGSQQSPEKWRRLNPRQP